VFLFIARVLSAKYSVRTVKHGNLGLAELQWGVNVPNAGCTMIQRVIGILKGRLMRNCTAFFHYQKLVVSNSLSMACRLLSPFYRRPSRTKISSWESLGFAIIRVLWTMLMINCGNY